MKRKYISIILVIALLFTAVIPANAIAPVQYDFSVSGLDYIVSEQNGCTVLTAYMNHALFDRIQINKTTGELLYENFQSPVSSLRTIYLDNRVEDSSSLCTLQRGGYTPKTSNLGSVRYRVVVNNSIEYRNISCHSTLVRTTPMAKTFNAEKGDTITVVIGLIMAAFVSLPVGFISVLANVLIMDTTNILSQNLEFELVGTAYSYTITESIDDGTGRTEYDDGYVYYGNVVKNGVITSQNRTVYSGCYPEFIEEEDNVVAMRVYENFYYGDMYYIDSYNPR